MSLWPITGQPEQIPVRPHMQRIARLVDHPRFARSFTSCDDKVTDMADVGDDVWRGLLARFVTHLEAGGAAAGTIRLRLTYLKRLAATHEDVDSITIEDLELWLGHDWKPETRKSARTSVCLFFAWAHRRGHLERDPSADLPTVSIPMAEARPAPLAVIRETLARADASPDWRDPLLVRLALHAGLRVHEIAKVHTRDVEGERLRIHGKGGRSRLVQLSPALLLAIRDRRGYLFPGRIDGHLSAGYVQRRIDRLMPAGWTPHTLRHAAGSAVYEDSGFDLFATQAFLGHSKPETTRRYVHTPKARVDSAVLKAAQRWSGSEAS